MSSDGGGEVDELHVGDGDRTERHGHRAHHRGKAAGGGGEEQDGDVLQEHRHADGGDERRELRGVAEGAVGEALDDHPEHGGGDHGGDEHGGGDTRGGAVGGGGEQAEGGGGEDADVGADHEDVAVGEVDEPEDAVDHGVAEGDEGVDAAEGDALHEVAQEGRRALGRALEDEQRGVGGEHGDAEREGALREGVGGRRGGGGGGHGFTVVR